MGAGKLSLQNINPKLFLKSDKRCETADDWDENVVDDFDEREVFDLIRNINDPEHPLTLEELNVVDINNIEVDNESNKINVRFTPTIPHCSMATLIGLTIKVQLIRSLPARFKVSVKITPGTHSTEDAINKQLADKERVSAAIENSTLVDTINQCLATIEKYYN
ncbi:MIP18 family protein galla-2 [Cimex lectularius]|uniref:MIP18 family-like domain-containing protein n=1 Tax=Cimex lectularius TaxID=79782 RepID=A0A8I6THP4_CIMLE|nr:MIP18 family protein galla-2 [Cimex lectularius]